MQFYPYLMFDGQCEAAFQFYEQCLHGKTVFLITYQNTPMDPAAPPEWRKKVSHATFALGEARFYGADALPGHYQRPQGFALQLDLGDPMEAERIFNALAKNGAVRVPIAESFWALRFGMLIDQFGIAWHINCEKPS